MLLNRVSPYYSPSLTLGDFDFFGEFCSITLKTPMYIFKKLNIMVLIECVNILGHWLKLETTKYLYHLDIYFGKLLAQIFCSTRHLVEDFVLDI